MKKLIRKKAVIHALGAALTLALATGAAHACATITNDVIPVRVADESALIIWDSASQTEHFIRRATFETSAQNLGFLVPTPAQPELGEAEDQIFERLEEIIRPRVIHRNVRQYQPASIFSVIFSMQGSAEEEFTSASNTAAAPDDSVEVISEQRAAGYDTAILRANDVDALQLWLKKHHYVSGPAFDKWLQPYVRKGWFITAFKYVKDAQGEQISSDAVLMTFKAAEPFFPYREPEQPQQQTAAGRLLRVFLLAPGRMDGHLQQDNAQFPWNHQVPYVKHFEYDDLLPQLSTFMKPGWLTVFEDRSTVRSSAGDLFWQFAKKQEEVEPTPIIKNHYVPVSVPVEPFLLLFAGIGWMVWKRRTT